MTSDLAAYLRLGLAHITDLQGYDHILFVVALTAAYRPADWRRLLWLVTAFTVGHSLTLALATLDVVRVPAAPVEAAIAVTIVLTAAMGALAARPSTGRDAPLAARQAGLRYTAAAVFGLVHGLGFSGFLRALLGDDESILLPLVAFNAGLEVGQLAIVAVTLAAGVAVERLTPLARHGWVLLVSAAVGLAGLRMVAERLG